MSEPRTIHLAGRDLPVIYTARARYLFESLTSYPLSALRVWRDPSHPSDVELTCLLVAGLEGARLREARPARRTPWTRETVMDDLIDPSTPRERGDALTVCIQAVGDAFGAADGDNAADTEDATGAEGKAHTEG